VKAIASYDTLEFRDPESQQLHAADIPLKTTDTTFSEPLVLKKGWYYVKGIAECRIIDTPQGAEDEGGEDGPEEEDEEVHDDVEQVSLFDEDEGK
jgi:topoisomerase-4 subunit A